MINRRNVLIGLGTAVAAGGAAIGTGAFDQVEATRDVEIDAAGDSAAQVGIDLDGSLDGGDNDVIEFELDGDVNLDATTTFSGALTVTNNDAVSFTVDILDEDDNSMIDEDGESEGSSSSDLRFKTSDSLTLSDNGDSVDFDVVFDLEGVTSEGEEDIPESVTIEATGTSN